MFHRAYVSFCSILLRITHKRRTNALLCYIIYVMSLFSVIIVIVNFKLTVHISNFFLFLHLKGIDRLNFFFFLIFKFSLLTKKEHMEIFEWNCKHPLDYDKYLQIYFQFIINNNLIPFFFNFYSRYNAIATNV